MTEIDTKCRTCGKEPPEVGFYPSNRNKCKACIAVQTKAWRAANPERAKAAWKACRERTPVEVKRETWNSYFARNREARTAWRNDWMARNPEKRAVDSDDAEPSPSPSELSGYAANATE